MATWMSTRQLAGHLSLPERQIEEHLDHVVKTLSHDRTRRFFLERPECGACGYRFPGRTKLTCPSRCPRCRSEAVLPPRFMIKSLTGNAPR